MKNWEPEAEKTQEIVEEKEKEAEPAAEKEAEPAEKEAEPAPAVAEAPTESFDCSPTVEAYVN